MADISSVQEKPVVGFGNDVGRDISDEGFLRLERVLAVGGETETFADAEDMGIDGHGRLVPNDGTDDVGSFASDSLKGLQVLDIIGYDAVVRGDESLRHGNQMF